HTPFISTFFIILLKILSHPKVRCNCLFTFLVVADGATLKHSAVPSDLGRYSYYLLLGGGGGSLLVGV
ncbi:MAG: hypothetical protein J5965_13525, partial [Aeriscardovia sp.]|nr:hypothetical protein [Aeriscardovia sp.]